MFQGENRRFRVTRTRFVYGGDGTPENGSPGLRVTRPRRVFPVSPRGGENVTSGGLVATKRPRDDGG